MAKKRDKKHNPISIKDILKGKFLVEGDSFRHWKFVFFLSLLVFISIGSSHWADRKVIEIRKLQNTVSNLKSEHSFVHKQLMQKKMRSHVKEIVIKDSIKEATEQPLKLIHYK